MMYDSTLICVFVETDLLYTVIFTFICAYV